jgi:hypothetical protein
VIYKKHKGTTSQTERVEQEYPTYFHQLYREATVIIRDNATFGEIALQMNLLSTVDK